MQQFKNYLKNLIEKISNYFFPKYKITESFNKIYGDADDKSYISKKIITQKEKHLKFKDENNRLVEFRSSAGLNYIIEDV